jgi:hypothetical protein
MSEPAAPSGFTAVVCRSAACGRGDSGTVAEELFAALRDTVRRTRHGVLVSSGCLIGPSACRTRAPAPFVLVQPCDPERRPRGSAVHVGPLRTRADVETLVTWLRDGRLDAGLLPAHLLGVHRRMAAAPLN